MDAFRRTLDVLDSREGARLGEHRAARARIIRQTNWAIVGGLVLGLAGALTAMALAATWVVRRMRHLEANAQRLAAEEPLVPQSPRGDEIGRVEDAMVRASDLLRERRERLVTAMEGGRVLAWELDIATGHVAYGGDPEVLNRAGFPASLLPTTVDEWLATVHPDDADAVRAVLDGSMVDGEPFEVEFRRPLPDGTWAWRAVRGRVVRPDASLAGIVRGVTLDVTAQKAVEERLAEQNEALRAGERRLRRAREELVRERGMLQAVLDNMAEGVVLANADGEFLVFNPAAREIIGIGATERGPAEWQEAYGLFLPDGETPFPAGELPLVRALAGEESIGVEMISRHEARPEGVRLEVAARPVADEQGTPLGALAVFRDVTESHRVEEELAERREELERSNAELEQFAYVASHDLQEPLRMVASYTQLLARRYRGRLDDDADEFIGYAVDGATRMQALINDLLTYSRVQRRQLELTTVSSAAAVDAALSNLRGAIQDRDAVVQVDDELPEVRGDLTQLTQLFQNLMGNALKFTNGARPEVHVGVRRRPEEWVFSVSDNGIGIDPQHTERIFEVFQRLHTREEYPGTGIGLAVCKKIVERIGGRIWVQSEPGSGATFSFAIPTERRSGHARVPERRG